MKVSDATQVRLEHLHGQLDRTAYLLDDAANGLTAVDFRKNGWQRAANDAILATNDAWKSVQEFYGWSKSDAAEITDFGIRKAAVSTLDITERHMDRNMTAALGLSGAFDFKTDRVTARNVIDTMARLTSVTGSAIRDAADGMISLAA